MCRCTWTDLQTKKEVNKHTKQSEHNTTQNTVSIDILCNASGSLKPSNQHLELAASEHGVTASSKKPVIIHESTQTYIPEDV